MDNHGFLQDGFSDKRPKSLDHTLLASDPTPPTGKFAIEAVDTLILPVAGKSARKRRGSHRLRALFIALPIVLLLLLGSGGYALARPHLPANSATLNIIPTSKQFSKTYTVAATPGSTDATLNPIGARRISYTTPAKSVTVPGTGMSHHGATYATGTLTIFVFSGGVPAGGYTLTGKSGVVVQFFLHSQPAFRTNTVVSAQAVKAGSAGNIPANDLVGAYELTPGEDFSVPQSSAFTGGSNGGDTTAVSQTDIDSATSQVTNQLQSGLETDLTQLKSKLGTGEQLLGGNHAVACQPSLKANHKANEEASTVTVTGTMMCSTLAYNSNQLQTYATNHLTADAAGPLGSGYALIAQAQTRVNDQSDQDKTVSFALDVSGRFFYQLSPNVQTHLLRLIAGEPQAEAQQILLQQPGIATVRFTVSGGLGTALPGDAKTIRVRITG